MPIVSREKNALILKLRDPSQVKRLIPKHQVIMENGVEYTAVPHTDTAFRILKNIGMKMKGLEPMRHKYQYPKLRGKHDPRPSQIETAVGASVHKRFFILNEMRTGKTAAVLWCMQWLKQTKQMGESVLVTCTNSCTDSVWRAAIFELFPEATVAVLRGSAETRKKLLKMQFDFFIINHDGLKVIPRDLLQSVAGGRIKVLVVDEGTEFAAHGTDKWRVMKSLCGKADRVVWLTGTPLARGADMIWGQMQCVAPERITGSFSTWRDTVMRKSGPFKWVNREGYEKIVYEVMQPAVRFKRSDVLEPLSVSYEYRKAELSLSQTKAINFIKKEGALMFKKQTISAVNAAVLMGKILQISMGAVKDDDGEIVHYPVTERLAVLDELIEQANAKVIVFAPYKAVVDLLVNHNKKKHSVMFIDGRVTGTERTNVIVAFQERENPRVLVAHPKTTGHGLELSAADTVVWYGPLPVLNSTDLYEQATARVMSGSQKNAVGVYHVHATSLEHKFFLAQRKGVAAQQEVLALFEEEIFS